MIQTALEIVGAVVGIALVVRGLRLALGRPRPMDLGGMALAALGMALAVWMITAASGALR